jgi:hypothetical protein
VDQARGKVVRLTKLEYRVFVPIRALLEVQVDQDLLKIVSLAIVPLQQLALVMLQDMHADDVFGEGLL